MRPVLTSFILSLALLPGCAPTAVQTSETNTAATPATFAGATAEQRLTAVSLALGTASVEGYFSAMKSIYDAWLDPELNEAHVASNCPVLDLWEQEGAAYALSANGCVGHRSGTTWSGAWASENLVIFPFGETTDASAPTSLTFEQWSDGATTYDGEVASTRATAVEGAPLESNVDLVISSEGGSFTLKGQWVTSVTTDGGFATVGSGTSDITGLGSFALESELAYLSDNSLTGGVVVLRGADTYTVDLSDIDAAGCAAATLDGEATEPLCPADASEPTEEPTEELDIAIVYSYDETGIELHMQSNEPLGEAFVLISALDYDREGHTLALTSVDSEGYEMWTADVVYDAQQMDSGYFTKIPPGSAHYGLLFTAQSVLGESVCIAGNEAGLAIGENDAWWMCPDGVILGY